VTNLRTVSDTKRNFYQYHTRPINSVYRRVVDEMLVEMHLLSVNIDFRYDPIYALGVVSTFDRFMTGYYPQADKDSIFQALCKSTGGDAASFRADAERLGQMAAQMNPEAIITCFGLAGSNSEAKELHTLATVIATNPKFKYSRLFTVGIYRLLELSDPEFVKNSNHLQKAIQKIGTELNLSTEKMQKDLELYLSNLEKMSQVLSVLDEALQADRKKRQERLDKQPPSQSS